MADLSDVRETLVQMISATLYPNGTGSPSVSGLNVRVFGGWPLPAQLEIDLGNETANVSVYPRPEEHNTTRYMDEWEQVGCNPTLLTLEVVGQTVTVGGQVPPATNPHHVMLLVNGRPYPYLVQVTDTLASVAAALAQLVAGDYPGQATTNGAIIVLTPNLNLQAARVGNTQTIANEVRRQFRTFQIVVWAWSDEARIAVAKPVDLMLASTRRFALPDDTWARLIYQASHESDSAQKVSIYRRDLLYRVEFCTRETDVATQITQFEAIATTGPDQGSQPIATVYS